MGDIAGLPLIMSIPALVVIGATIVDAARRSDLPPVRRAGWIVVAVLLPVVGTFLYLLARPFRDPARPPARGNARTEALVGLVRQHDEGEIGPDAYLEAKKAIFFGGADE